MHLRSGEAVVRVVKRHRSPFIIKLCGALLVSLLIYIPLFGIADAFDTEVFLWILAVISFLVGIFMAVVSLDYLLDKLVITNKRVVAVDWKNLFRREEHEAELVEIQNIITREKGILARLHIFDYGMIEIETAASKTFVVFEDCPDPEEVKTFLFTHLGGIRAGRGHSAETHLQ